MRVVDVLSLDVYFVRLLARARALARSLSLSFVLFFHILFLSVAHTDEEDANPHATQHKKSSMGCLTLASCDYMCSAEVYDYYEKCLYREYHGHLKSRWNDDDRLRSREGESADRAKIGDCF